MQLFKDQVAKALAESIEALVGNAVLSAEDVSNMLEYPPDPAMGDLAMPCFRLSKTLRRSPVQIAAQLAEQVKCACAARIEAVNGYLNFYLSDDVVCDTVVGEILQKGEKYGAPTFGEGKTVVLDYSSPNLAKPFHIGHLGTTVIGHSLRRLHEFAGYHCTGINYVGDWGTQFGKLIVAYKKWGDRDAVEQGGVDALVDLYVRINNAIADDPALADEARAEFLKMEQGDEENLALWKWLVEKSIKANDEIYRQLGISFDSYKGESAYTDLMPAQVQKLRDMGLLKIDDGASIVDLEAYGMPPCLILKRDGSSLYPTRDIAAAVDRFDMYHYDKSIYVTSAGQSLHFKQWFKVVEMMGYPWADRLVHVPYGTVSINGAKLATRTGNVILLRDLFGAAIEKVSEIMDEKSPNMPNKAEVAEAVGVGAIVFYYLSNNRIRDINFIMEDALSFEGNTGPYAQYTYARSCSIVSKAQAAGMTDLHAPVDLTGVDLTEEENALVKTLALFPDKVVQALHESEPSVITRYILDVCADFNRFYHDVQILSCEDEALRSFRVKLTLAVKYVLGTAFDLICIGKNENI